MQGHSKADGYRELMGSVIARAVDDLKEIGPRCGKKEPDLAMAFILSEDCEAFCLELGVNYKSVREKAASLYRRIIGKEGQEYGGKNCPRRSLFRLKRVHKRQRPGKPNSGSYG